MAGWHLLRSGRRTEDGAPDPDRGTWRSALKIGAATLLIAAVGVSISGDLQGKVMTQVQPMKMASAEALYDTAQPAPFSVLTIGTPDGQRELWSITVPKLLSFLATGHFDGKVQGIRELQAEYTQAYGPGQYAPNIPLTYWSFRWMIALGMAGAAAGAWLLWSIRGDRDLRSRLWLPVLIALPLLPLFGNSLGWIFTETGRQPWLVFGLLKTVDGVSPSTSVAEVATSMIVFTALYGSLAVVEIRLMLRTLRKDLPELETTELTEDADRPLEFAY